MKRTFLTIGFVLLCISAAKAQEYQIIDVNHEWFRLESDDWRDHIVHDIRKNQVVSIYFNENYHGGGCSVYLYLNDGQKLNLAYKDCETAQAVQIDIRRACGIKLD